MKILVTGAGGWIGSMLIRRLIEERHEVVAMVRPGGDRSRLAAVADRVRIVECELTDLVALAALVQAERPERCYHFAWYAVPGRYGNAPENIDVLHATAHLARLLAAAGCRRFVGAGTEAEYDPAVGYLREDSATRPRSLYAAAKLSCGLLVHQVAAPTEMAVTWARLFLSYGPSEDARRLVPSLMIAQVRGEPVATSPGEQVRDYLHVEDLASGIHAAAEAGLDGPVNIGSGKPVAVREVIDRVGAIGGRPELFDIGARGYAPGEPMFVCANVDRLRSTGWTPRYDLDGGLRATYSWWREWLPGVAPADRTA